MSQPSHDDAVAELLARERIRALPYRYAAAIESRDIDAMAELFTPTARFGRYGQGPDAVRTLMADTINDSVFAVILVANHLVDVHGASHATGQVWAHCYAQTRSDGFLDQLIKYDDRYELSNGQWLFAHRRHRLFYGASHRESPLTQPAARWPLSQIGVGDIPMSDPAFIEWWQDRRDD